VLTQERLKEILHYNHITGILVWKISRRGVRAGVVAGFVDSRGYIQIRINDKAYRAHRLAWFYVHGVWPNKIDHEDHIKTHNWMSNLRNVSCAQNNKNKSKSKANTSGITGVRWKKRACKWVATIGSEYKERHLGYFDDIDDAATARKAAENELGFHENHGKKPC